jgi:glycosyltransferase involved in cell wall biosynthesis
MKILYACCEDASNQNAWSGLVYHIRLALVKAGFEIEVFDHIPFECPLKLRFFHQYYKRFSRQVHQLQIEPVILQNAARRIERRFFETGCDAVFCPGTGVPVNAFIDPAIPVFTYLDATKRTWIETYFGLETLCPRSRKLVDFVDQHALKNNTLTLFSSDWAQQAALRETAVSPARTAVVPFGANLADSPASNEVEAFIVGRDAGKCRLLFLGKEWERKGGLEALAIVRGLRGAGISAELDVIGCTPKIPADLKQWVRVHGFIDRSTGEGRARFREIISNAHLLLFFSKAEAYGLALCETNAFGVPCLATSVGGIPTIIRDGVNGFLFPPPLNVADCVERTIQLMRNFEAYKRLACTARAEFELRLNWVTAGLRLRQLIESHLNSTAL